MNPITSIFILHLLHQKKRKMNFFRFLKSKSFFTQIGIALISILLFVAFLQWWLGFTTNHDQKIQVPDLHKMSLLDVENTLKDLDLDFLVIDSASYNPNYPKKSVIEQTPEAGDFVKEKRKIYLTLNPSKYRDIRMPDIYGLSRRQAITQLQSIGFKIGDFSYVADIGKDVVRGIKSNDKKVKPGTKLSKNTVIDLILGDGKGK